MSEWRELSGPLDAFTLGSGHRIVFAHGFTQTSTSWKPIAEHFAANGFEAVIVDLPGHGGSGEVRADLRRGADMLNAMVGRATYVGYSLGGRFCLHAAVMFPGNVRRLALLGTSPGIDDDDERARRRAADDRLAAHMREVGLEAFLDEWVAQPLFGGLQLSAADRADRLRNTVDGLESSLFMAGNGAQGSLWRRLRELSMPVLALAGALDDKFMSIAEQTANAVIRGTFVAIPDAAHAVHLQQPAAVIAALEAWLADSSTLGP